MCRCKSFASLRATAFEHELPAFGAHPHTKTMCFGAATIIRLKGPLHALLLLENVFAENSKIIETTGQCQACAADCGN
jgi:hypothetical protein